jgi:alpha-methylacyl-CoA racemase
VAFLAQELKMKQSFVDQNPPLVGPLKGIRIVEFAGMGAAPFASMLLADLGAEIVRIERPDSPDKPASPIAVRGRRRIRANLKSPADLAKILELTDAADGLIEAYRPGVMERLGLGPTELLARNPKLVYGRLTGWGQTGPLAYSAGHDINYIAITGALAAIGSKERPIPPLNVWGDFAGGALYLVMGMLAATIAAKRTGVGDVIDAAMCDGSVSLMTAILEKTVEGEWIEEREANVFDGGAPFYRTYECADGRHVSVGPIEPAFFRQLCEVTGLKSSVDVERRELRENWAALRADMEALFRRKTRDEWTAILEGTDACYAPVLALSEAPRHRHLVARKVFVEEQGVIQPTPTPHFSAARLPVRPVDLSPFDIASFDGFVS